MRHGLGERLGELGERLGDRTRSTRDAFALFRLGRVPTFLPRGISRGEGVRLLSRAQTTSCVLPGGDMPDFLLSQPLVSQGS